MINNQDKDQMELEAIQLIDQAEILANKGKGEEAISYYEKAAQIYLDFGSYIELDRLFIRIIEIISQFKNHIVAIYRLNSIIRKTEDLQLFEISARLLIELGNISYQMNDWESAGESWEKASYYLIKTDPEEYDTQSCHLLLKAGQAFERSPIRKDYGKRLILKAIMKINKFDELYEQEEKRAYHLIKNKEFEASANKFFDIATYFRKALENLSNAIDEQASKETILNVKARFFHFVAEYQTLSALCLKASENPAYNEKINELAKDSIKLFKESISRLKEYLFPIKSDFDKEIILRITFDTMLLTIIQELSGIKEVETIYYLFENIETNKVLITKLKESPYFTITDSIKKIGLQESLNRLLKVHLGHFEEIKNTLISYFT
ncbi:MAG: hypothetical protein ACFFDK_06330 [Promethearchaeota archaeon]